MFLSLQMKEKEKIINRDDPDFKQSAKEFEL